MTDQAKAIELAKQFVSEPDKRAQVKVVLCEAGLPLIADMIDEAVIVSRALLSAQEQNAAPQSQSAAEGPRQGDTSTPASAAPKPSFLEHLDQKLFPDESSAAPDKLTKPAQVGNTRFGVGVSASLVIDRAQREYNYQNTPEREAERLAKFRTFQADVMAGAAPDSGGIPETTRTFDARTWAKSFNETLVKLGYQPHDEGWLISWFANAIMCGYDHALSLREKLKEHNDG